MATRFPSEFDRRRAGWWLVAAGVVGIVGLFFLSFVGTFIFGLFLYYGPDPSIGGYSLGSIPGQSRRR